MIDATSMLRMIAMFVFVVSGLLPVAVRAGDDTTADSLIPFDSLTATNRVLVQAVTDHYTLRREYAARPLAARKEHFDFLMTNMEATSALAQKTGLITYRLEREADGRMRADDHEGANGSMLKVFSDANKCIYFVEGTQNGIFHVHGRGVVVIDYKSVDPQHLEYTGALYVKVENAAAAALTQIFSIFVRDTVDKYFNKVMQFPTALSETAQTNPQKLRNQIGEMPAADQKLLAPFADLLPTTNGPPAKIQ